MSIDSPTTSPFAIAVAVGPGPREIERLIDLADSVAAYERGPAHFVMVDDSPEPRGLDRLISLPSSIAPVSLHHPRHGAAVTTFKIGKGICSAVLLALGWIQANTDAGFALKLDTDSLVIGPFRDRLSLLFAPTDGPGVVGAYTLTPNGTPRDFTVHGPRVAGLARFDWRRPRAELSSRRRAERALVRPLLAAADANGYTPGEHCMGGGYAVGRRLLDRIAAAGYFADVSRWTSVDLPEDVMLGLHARAVGATLANDVDRGGVFGVRYQGLPFAPTELVDRGHAVIHAVKNDPTHAEADVRAFFTSRRDAR